MKKNILFVTHDTLLYGANQSLINIISALKNEDVKVKVVFPDKGPICKRFDDLGIDYFIIKYKSEFIDPRKNIKSKFLNFLRLINKNILNGFALKKLRKFVKLHNITIIHSNSSVVGIGEELAKKENLRHVWHVREYIDLDHGMDVFGGLHNLRERIRKSDKVICISQSIFDYFGIQNNGIVLYNSVRKEVKPFLSNKRSHYYLFCGSLVKNKGVENAIYAFRNVFSHNNKLELYIAGSGEPEYEIYLKKLVLELNIEKNVKFLGFRKDTDLLMMNALALLMCSKHEALGRVTIEAMLNSCLVIGFNNAGTSELIKNKVTGILYEKETELLDYMIEVSNDSENNFEMIRLNAYNYSCDNFLEKHYTPNLIRYYDLP